MSVASIISALLGILKPLFSPFAAYLKGRSDAKKAESLKRVQANLDAAIDQLEMHREADAIERANTALADEEARRKAGRIIK